MKKFIFVLFIPVLIFLTLAQHSSASVLYTNTLTSTSGNLSNWYDTNCHLTEAGASCDGNIAIYDSHIDGSLCVSGDYTVSPSSQKDDFLMYSDDPSDANALQVLAFRPGSNLRIVTTAGFNYDTGFNTPMGLNTYTICKSTHDYSVFINGNLITTQTIGNYLGTYIGFQLSNTDTLTNLTVTDSLPTNPTPTPTPTPTPSQPQLSVTSLKQTDPAWKNFTYDKANIWAPTNPTIGNWGCALTSATMVLNYYNIHKLPGQGNTELTPATLDAWLNLQKDGYLGNGLVNWLAIARLTLLAKSNNPTFPFDALEYTRVAGQNNAKLLEDLNAGHPDILEEPGHFVVATGQQDATFNINDPYYSRDTLASYGNSYSSIGTYLPSFTDLSYILITGSPDVNMTLKDSTGNPVGDTYIQQPITGAESNTQSGNPIQILELQKPPAGSYTLTVSGTAAQTTTLTGYLYDSNGNPSPFTKTTIIDPQNQATYELSFNPESTTNDSITKVVTYDSFLMDLNDLYNTKAIKKATLKSFTSLIKNAQKQQRQHHAFIEKIDLMIIEGLLKSQKRLMSNTAYQILLEDVQYLQKHL